MKINNEQKTIKNVKKQFMPPFNKTIRYLIT